MRNVKVDCVARTPQREYVAQAEKDDASGVSPFRALSRVRITEGITTYKTYLGTIAERTDHDHKEQRDVELSDVLC